MLKKILGGLLSTCVVLIGVAYLLPRQAHVERTVVVARPAAEIFPYLNSLRRASAWSPWNDYDPNVNMTYSGPESGVGARMAWAGNKKVGTGSQVIIASVPDRKVASDLQFGGGGPAKAELVLGPSGAGTSVVWSLDIDLGNNPIGRYMGLLMDKMVGPDYERGLTKLKTLIETATATPDAASQPLSAPSTSANAPTS